MWFKMPANKSVKMKIRRVMGAASLAFILSGVSSLLNLNELYCINKHTISSVRMPILYKY